MGERDIRNVFSTPLSTAVTGRALTPSSSYSYQPFRSMPPIFGASDRRRPREKSGSTLVPTLFVKVWPSLSSFCRCPSTRWPKISWKNTPAARPEKIAGPDERLGLRRLEQLRKIVRHAVDGRQQDLVVRQPGGIDGFEGFEGAQVGAVGRLGRGGNRDPGESAAVLHAAMPSVLTRYRVSVCAERRHVRSEHARVVLEAVRELADPRSASAASLN